MAVNYSNTVVKSATDVSLYLVQEYGLKKEEAVDLCLTDFGKSHIEAAIALSSMAYYPGDSIMENLVGQKVKEPEQLEAEIEVGLANFADHSTYPVIGETGHTFQKKLEHLINEYSKETESNTPDFILAEYLNSCLNAYNKAHNSTVDWHKE